MELDGYNEEKKIAFEHHGIQHYKENGQHRGKNDFQWATQHYENCRRS